MTKTHYISNGSGHVEVYSEYARELDDNGLQDDDHCTLMIAPQVNAKCELLYMTTNGDDVLIGWFDDDGRYEQSDSVAEWIDAPDCDWLREAIDEFQVAECS